MSKQKILFIDRDGTLVEEPADEQVDALEKIRFKPGVFRWLGLLAERTDYKLVMVSNQDGLGTDAFPEDTFWPAQNFILQALEGEGIRFDDLVCAEDRSFYFDALFKARRYVRTDARWVVHRVGIPTSLDGSDVRLRNFEVEFRSFELIWSRVQDATEEQRLLVLESCIGDSLYYFRRAYDTEYELPLARMLYDYWHDYLQLLGNISGRHWYVDVARMIADCQQPAYRRLLLDLLNRYEEDRRYQHRLDWLKHKVLLGAEDTARAALGLWQRIPLPWRRRGSA